jgi:hypothetical protein
MRLVGRIGERDELFSEDLNLRSTQHPNSADVAVFLIKFDLFIAKPKPAPLFIGSRNSE